MKKAFLPEELAEIRLRYRVTSVFLVAFYLLGGVFLYLRNHQTQSDHSWTVGWVCIACYGVILIFGFLLTVKVSGTVYGILTSLFMAVPLVGVIPITITTIRTHFILRKFTNAPAPATPLQPAGILSAEEINRLIKFQKNLILSILIYLACSIVARVMPFPLTILFFLAEIAAWITSIALTFALANEVYKKRLGIVMGILTVIPLINLFPILKVSNATTYILRQEGIRVGFLGAKAKA